MKRVILLLIVVLFSGSCAIVNRSVPVESSDDALGCAGQLLGYLGYEIVDDVYTTTNTIRAERDARVSEYKLEREMDRITITVSDTTLRAYGETVRRDSPTAHKPPSREVRQDVEKIVRECGAIDPAPLPGAI